MPSPVFIQSGGRRKLGLARINLSCPKVAHLRADLAEYLHFGSEMGIRAAQSSPHVYSISKSACISASTPKQTSLRHGCYTGDVVNISFISAKNWGEGFNSPALK